MAIAANKHQMKGVGLVEVLVALIVISIGMLGIAALYVTAIQAKSTSSSRMKAVNLAYDIADRIRANANAVANYAQAQTSTTTLTAPSKLCKTAPCTGPELAAADLYEWNSIAIGINGLPGTVTRTITVNAGTPSTFIITLSWVEQTGNTSSYLLQGQI